MQGLNNNTSNFNKGPLFSHKAKDVFIKNWLDDEKQFALLSCGLKTPVRASYCCNVTNDANDANQKVVYVPYIGEEAIKHVWAETGGNPLALEPREKMCLVVSPIIRGLNYEAVFHGLITENGDEATILDLPHYFRQNVQDAIDYTLASLEDLTTHPYEVLACKLNPLNSGKANVVIYVKFAYYCEFDRQMYYTPFQNNQNNHKIRIIPKPIITAFAEPEPGYKITLSVLNGDQDMFHTLYPVLQTLAQDHLKMHLRFIKASSASSSSMQMQMQMQRLDSSVPDSEVLGLCTKFCNIKNRFLPYIIQGIECVEIMV